MRINKITSCFCCILFIGTTIQAQQLESNNRFSKWLINDPLSIPSNFTARNFSQVGILTLSITSISLIDEPSSNYFQKEYSNSKFLNFSNSFGDFNYVAPVSAIVFGASLLTKNNKFQDAAFTSFQSVLNTALTVNISKFIFARSRPYQNDGAYDFDFFQRGETSFPSGHASTAFALFTPWVMYYPGFITYSLMTIPIGTVIARMAKGKHWASDVTAGAIIGTYWGLYLSKKHLQKVSNEFEITPFIEGTGGGISVNISFKP